MRCTLKSTLVISMLICVERLELDVLFRLIFASSYLPPLGSTILEPRLHLGVGHFEATRQCGSFSGSQVLLLVEPFLKFCHLGIALRIITCVLKCMSVLISYLNSSERGARLLSLGRRSILIRMSYPTGDGEGGCWQTMGNVVSGIFIFN